MTKEELLNIAKPIFFNTEMVRAILDGRKTVTRRVVKQKYENTKIVIEKGFVYEALDNFGRYTIFSKHKVGDILYVRETWYIDENMPYDNIFYRADEDNLKGLWKPSIHMPKEAARIFLKVSRVKLEKLHDAKSDDWIKEGAYKGCYDCMSHGGCYMPNVCGYIYKAAKKVWNSTIKKQDLSKYGWNANPWVWVYEFERIEL